MQKEYSQKYLRLEETNWWFMARRDMVSQLVKRFSNAARIIDVGCSGGAIIKRLAEEGYHDIKGIDLSRDAIERCIEQGIAPEKLAVADAVRTGLRSDSYDLLIASDILEHIENDRATLAEWRRILKPGGSIIIFVPAYNFLFGQHDKINQHFRRYTLSRLSDLLKQSGFKIIRGSYWNVMLLLPAVIFRLLSRSVKGGGDQLFELPSALNRILYKALTVENAIISAGVNFPFGVSAFCLAQK
jgi:SAM-dependent methyltransferase